MALDAVSVFDKVWNLSPENTVLPKHNLSASKKWK